MNKPNNPNQNGGDHAILFIIIFIFALILIQKAIPILVAIWERNKIMFCLALASVAAAVLGKLSIQAWNEHVKKSNEDGITSDDPKAALLGKDIETGKSVYLRQEFRTMHMQIIGTTNAGKSESTVIPLAVKDIQNGNGLILIDGKSDGRSVDKLYSYAVKYGREKDFRLFSLANLDASSTFNPLRGENPQQVAERVFSSFKFENEYYRNVQYKIFLGLIRLIREQKETPTFLLVKRLLTDMDSLRPWVEATNDDLLKKDMTAYMNLIPREREEKVSGLETALSNFTSSDIGLLFEETTARIDFDEAMAKKQIVYFQLPTMFYPFLGEATGRLVLQCLQSAIAKRQMNIRGGNGTEPTDVLLLHP